MIYDLSGGIILIHLSSVSCILYLCEFLIRVKFLRPNHRFTDLDKTLPPNISGPTPVAAKN